MNCARFLNGFSVAFVDFLLPTHDFEDLRNCSETHFNGEALPCKNSAHLFPWKITVRNEKEREDI